MGAATVCVSMLFMPLASLATELLKPADLDSPGAIALRKLSKDVINASKPKRFSLDAKRDDDPALAGATDEIIVRGQRDPEDIFSKRPPMLAFRDRLARERPSTPQEKVQRALCFIGLCAVEPIENTAFSRAEQGAKKSSLELSQQFRGTFQ